MCGTVHQLAGKLIGLLFPTVDQVTKVNSTMNSVDVISASAHTSFHNMTANCSTAMSNNWQTQWTEMRLLNTATKQHVTVISMYNNTQQFYTTTILQLNHYKHIYK